MRKEIALILDYNDNFAKTVVDGVAKYSLQTDWRFMTHRGVPSITFEQLQHWHGDGVIGFLYPQVIEFLSARNIPAVNVKTDFSEFNIASVLTDNRKIGSKAAEYLIGKGFVRFAFASGPIAGLSCDLKYQGFLEYLQDHGFSCCHLEQQKQTALSFYHEEPHLPLAVLAVQDFVGRMILEEAIDAQLRIPEDIAVLGVNNSPFICSMVHPQMSSIELGAERIGFQAAALLDELMQGKPRPKDPIIISPESIVERQSTDLLGIDDRLVPMALKFIKEHVSQSIGVEDVARASGCGRRTLEKRFQAILGRSPHQQIRRIRIEHACQLLRETDAIIDDISSMCGYATRDRFNVAFKSEINTTPSQYRKQYRFAKQE